VSLGAGRRERTDTRRMKLLSGGQSGVDRAVFDVALARDIPYGGWCPKGGWAEDFPEPPGVLAKYPRLAETDFRVGAFFRLTVVT
jgi:hypothetical protein